MRFQKLPASFGIVLLMLSSVPAWAQLQNVEVSGDIRIRWRYWHNVFSPDKWENYYVTGREFPGRPLGDVDFPPRDGIWSRFKWDNRGGDRERIELRTRLAVKADFVNHVRAVVMLESFDLWGEDFRSDYATDEDLRANSTDDVEFIEAYIEANQTFGLPLRIRAGRQMLKLGKGWLVSGAENPGPYATPFDALRLTFDTNRFTLDTWWSKLAENSPAEEDGDVDFYGLYGTYKGLNPMNLSAYWLWVRDAVSRKDQALDPIGEWVEDLLDVDDYGVTNLHTIGVRVFGVYSAFDYDLDVAYQMGNASAIGYLFRPLDGLYGDDDAEFDNWGMDGEMGYRFDARFRPRVFMGGVYFGSDDNRDIGFLEWLDSLFNPFHTPRASVSFDRLFSERLVTRIFDPGRCASNFWQVRLGLQTNPSPKTEATCWVAYYGVVDEFDHPALIQLGRHRIPLAPQYSFWTSPTSDELGWETTLRLKYDYSEALSFTLWWQHFFIGDGMADGNYTDQMGLANAMGSDSEDADYIRLAARLCF